MPLVNSIEMFKKAYEGKYAVGAFNINNMEQIQGIIDACQELNSPVILQVSRGARKYAKPVYLMKMVEAAILDSNIPVVLHLDHGDSFETCKACIDDGFTSVMIDGSHLSLDENIALTKKVCEYAHNHVPYVTVEGELGRLAGVEEHVNVSAEDSSYTNPEDVERFVRETGCDSLAIAIGTSHGAFKFKPGTKPQLRFDILEEVERRLPNFPIVLHGASSVPQDYIKILRENGGVMADAIGVPEDMLRQAAKMAVCKINIDSDVRIACTAMVRKHLADHPDHFDPRQFLIDARQAVHDMVSHKVKHVLGSQDKA